MIDDILSKYGVSPPRCGADDLPGWNAIIESLVSDLIAMGWDKDCHQVKEKYGGLRFYVGREDKCIEYRIIEAENWSFRTCVDCGAQGVRRPEADWIRVTCGRCESNRQRASGGSY